jgi:hypothetical protein
MRIKSEVCMILCVQAIVERLDDVVNHLRVIIISLDKVLGFG